MLTEKIFFDFYFTGGGILFALNGGFLLDSYRKTRKVICTAFGNGKRHDFRIFKKSKTHIHPDIQVETDTGFIGIDKIHANSVLPKKRSKKNPLTKEDKKRNKEISGSRVTNEHAIGFIKRFRRETKKYLAVE